MSAGIISPRFLRGGMSCADHITAGRKDGGSASSGVRGSHCGSARGGNQGAPRCQLQLLMAEMGG